MNTNRQLAQRADRARSEAPPEQHRSFPNMRAQVHLYGAHVGDVRRPWACPRHIHPAMLEINVALAGCQTTVIDGATIEQQAGDILVIAPMTVHEFRLTRTESLSYFVFHVETDDAAFMQLLERANATFYPRGTELNRLLTPLLRELADALDANAGKSATMAALFAAMAALERYFSAKAPPAAPEPQAELARRIAREIETIAAANPDEAADPAASRRLAAVARAVGISERHCNRTFRKLYGMSPREYWSLLRLQEAMHLLVHGSSTIERIAYSLGYQNAQSFSRQFKTWVGISPAAFRTERREELFYLTPMNRLTHTSE